MQINTTTIGVSVLDLNLVNEYNSEHLYTTELPI